MSVATKSAPTPVPALPAPIDRTYRLSVAQYLEMARLGILTAKDNVELLEGRLVTKMTKHPPHVLAGKKTFNALRRAIPHGWHVAKEDPVQTPDSVPEPDSSVLRGDAEMYRDRIPGTGDVALVVEVADSSLLEDQRYMKRIYAKAAFPTYLIVNIPDNRLEVYTDPTGPADAPDYRDHRDYRPGESVPLVLDGVEVARIAVRDLLP